MYKSHQFNELIQSLHPFSLSHLLMPISSSISRFHRGLSAAPEPRIGTFIRPKNPAPKVCVLVGSIPPSRLGDVPSPSPPCPTPSAVPAIL